MKHFFYSLAVLLLSARFVHAQTVTTTITADRYANPTLQWQGVYANYQGPNVGWSYSINNGSYLNAQSVFTGSEYYYGRYNFSHPSFPNSKITKVLLTVNCSRDPATTNGPAIAKITVPSCSVPWSSNASGQDLYNCLNNAPALSSNLSVSTNNDGSATNNTYIIHDPSVGVSNSGLWNASATSLAIGLKPWQNGMNIHSISLTITYTQDLPISNNVICCAQTFSSSGNPTLLTQSNGSLSGGTGSYTYQWQSSPNNSSWSNISGATGAGYDPPTISQTTYYRRIVSSGTASPSTSSAVKITINTSITGNTIGYDQSFYNTGNPSLLYATTSIGGGDQTYNYQWQSSTDNITYYSISGATNASYTPSTLTQTTYYKRVVTSAGFSSTSNVVTITISAGIAGNSICCNQTFVNSGDPAPLNQASGVSLNAGSSYTIQWLSSLDNVSYTAISGATSLSYDPPVTTQTIHYKREITQTSSSIVNTSAAVTITITRDPNILNNKIGYSQTFVSSGDPAAFNPIATLSGGNGTYTYQWWISTDDINWTMLAGTSPSYDHGPVSLTTYFRRIVYSGTAYPTISNTVVVTINTFGACQTKWTKKTPIGVDRAKGIGLSVNNKGYVGLGTNSGLTSYLNDLWKYDPLTDTWSQQTNFPGTARTNFYSFALNDKIYIGLGYSSSSTLLKDLWEFNTTSNSWVRKADFPFSILVSYANGFTTGNSGYITVANLVYEYVPNDLSNGTDVNGNPKGAWVQKQNLPSYGNSYNGFNIGNRAYVSVFNSPNTYLYEFMPDETANGCDTKNKTKGGWMQRSSIPSTHYNGPKYLFTISGKAYFQDASSSLIVYTPETDSYVTLNIASPVPANDISSFAINNIGYTHFRAFNVDEQFWQYTPSGLITGAVPLSLRAGNAFTVPFILTCGNYNSGVLFQAQLSDASGSFDNAVTIGSVMASTSASITAVVPMNVTTGSGYRVRVVSVSPSETGADNGGNISITDQSGNTGALFYNWEDGWQKQWVNKTSNGTTSGKIGNHTFNDNDIFYSGDFDGDGTQEMLIVSYNGGSNDYMDVVKYVNGEWINIWSNNGSSSPAIYPYRHTLLVGDFDGNGTDEVLGNTATWTTVFHFNNNNWQWGWSDYGNTSHPMYPYKNKFYVGKFYANAKTQLLGCSNGDWTTMFEWNGNDFAWGWSDYGGANPFRNYRGNMIIGDFNGDGRSDLLGLGSSAVVFQYNSSNDQYSQVWSSNGANNISGWNYPFGANDKVMASNIDSDSKSELVLVQKNGPYARTIDFIGVSGWNSNFQYAFVGDWSVSPPLNTSNSNYTMVKPRASEPSHMLTLRKTCGGLYTSAMYQTSTVGFNYRSEDLSGGEQQQIDLLNDLFVYPNPGDEVFNISLQKGHITELSVFNSNGIQVLQLENNENKLVLDVNSFDWAKGIYFIKVLTNSGELLSSKIIIQH